MTQVQISAKTDKNSITISIVYPLNPQLSHNFTLSIVLNEQNIANRTQTVAYKKLFHSQQKQIVINDLKFSAMYKIVAEIKYGMGLGAKQINKNVFVYTQAQRQQEEADEEQLEENEEQELNLRQRRPYQGRNLSVQQSRNEMIVNRKSKNQPSKQKPPKPVNNNNDLCNSELLIKTLAQSNHIVNKDQAHRYLLQSRKCRNVDEFINERHGKRINRQEVSDKRMLVIQSKLLFSEIYAYRDGCRHFQNNWCMGPFYSWDANQKQIRKQ